MSIATEIQRLQEAKADIKAAIEEKGVEVGNGLIDGYADKVDAVYEKGVQTGFESFTDDYINFKGGDFAYAFYKWSNLGYHPHENIVCADDAVYMYSYSDIEDTLVDITFTNSKITAPFYEARGLKTIRNIILQTNVTPANRNTFRFMTALENITFSGDGKLIGSVEINFANSLRLTKASIEAILNALYLESGGTLSLSTVAVNKHYTTDEWNARISELTANNWTVGLS